MSLRRMDAKSIQGPIVYLARWKVTESSPHDTAAIDVWIDKNLTGIYGWAIRTHPDDDTNFHRSQYGVRFADPNDAIQFKLRWG